MHTRTPSEFCKHPARFYFAAVDDRGFTMQTYQPNLDREYRSIVREQVKAFILEAQDNGHTIYTRRSMP